MKKTNLNAFVSEETKERFKLCTLNTSSAVIERLVEKLLDDIETDERGAAIVFNVLTNQFKINYGKQSK